MTNSYVISVSLETGCYRHIQISASATLYQLHKIILTAFDFEDDHAHAFFMDNRAWSSYDAYFSMEMRGGERLTKKYKLKSLNLKKGDKFKYLFDFGEDWCFQCKVLRELEERTDIPGVIRSVGQAPEQYPDLNDFDELNDGEEFPQIYEQEQIEELYRQLPISKAVVSLVRRYCEAASHLYGIIPLRVVLKLYNEQNPPIAQEEFLQIAEVMRHEANDFVILGAEAMYEDAPVVDPIDREIISLAIMECGPEEYYSFTQIQEGKAFAVLPKERFLEFEDMDYVPKTPQSEKMLKFLKKREFRSRMPAEDTLRALRLLIWLDAPMQAVMEGLQENSFSFKTQSEMSEFLKLFQEMNNHSRKIANRGQTPMELVENRKQETKEKNAEKAAERDPNQTSLWEE